MRYELQLSPAPTTVLEAEILTTLSPEQKKHYIHWRSRLSPPNALLAMLSSQYRTGKIPITRKEAKENDRKFGNSIDGYCGWEYEDWRRERMYRNGPNHPSHIVSIGVGTGLGLSHFIIAVAEGMIPEVYDWNPIALEYARKVLKPVFENYPVSERDTLRLGEASKICRELGKEVAILEMFRLIEHMSEEDATETLQGAGKILRDPRNRICVGGALEGKVNRMVSTETCIHFPRDFIFDNIQIGAGVPIYVYRERNYRDIEKEFTFQTFRSKLG